MIVDCAQKLGHIVAVTGDGVNDSPAIKKADIGIAMAIVGSDVAKDAADMLLMDDNFASIVAGVEQGRKIFDNLKKSIGYTIASNIPELLPFLSFVIIQIPVPLSTVLMLVIDLGTDMVPAVSLAYEYPELDIMFRKPRNSQEEHLVSGKLLINAYMVIGAIQTIAGYLAYVSVMQDYGFDLSQLPGIALSTDGTRPKKSDVYDKNSMHKGNTNVGTSEDRTQVDYISLNDASFDLRIWYWKIDKWQTCKFMEDKSPASGDRVCYSTEALKYAQFAYFLAIVSVQWSNLIIVKTKKLSIIEHGFRNKVSWWGLISETVISVMIGFIPGLNVSLGGRPLHFLHWFFPALPIFMLIVTYEEFRKLTMRMVDKKNRKLGITEMGWVERNTVY